MPLPLLSPGADNGGVVLAAYVQALFGQPGQWILSGVVLLACLTTAVGLVSTCADYFSTLTPLRYRQWVIVLSIICALVANVGLSQLIALSIPVLMALYPLAIALVALTFVRPWLPNPRTSFRTVMGVALIFSLLDGVRSISALQKVDGIKWLLDKQTEYMPLSGQGMAWVLPTAIMLVLVFLIPAKKANRARLQKPDSTMNKPADTGRRQAFPSQNALSQLHSNFTSLTHCYPSFIHFREDRHVQSQTPYRFNAVYLHLTPYRM